MRIQESLVTDKQIALELFSENGKYRLPIGGKDYYFPSLEKVHKAFLQQDTYDTIKLTHEGKKSYLHLFMDEIEVFDTKKALRQRLSQDSQGLWAEIRNGKTHYYMQQSGWTNTSYKEITEQECVEKLQHTSTMTKALGIGLGMLALLPGAFEFARHLPFGTKEAAMGLIALNQKSPVLGALGYSLLPKQVDAQAMGTEFQVNTYTTSDQDFPSVALLKDGGFVVAWQSDGQDGDRTGIYCQRYDRSGLPSGTEFQVNTYTTSLQRFPSVAPLNDGGFVVTWNSDAQDGGLEGVYGQCFDSNGLAVRGEFQINTYTTGNQENPSVAPLADGGFVVTWQSYGQDGDRDSVFGRRYDSSGVASGAEFQINTYTTSQQRYSNVATLNSGDFVVTWQSLGQNVNNFGIYGQRYTSNGVAAGTEFQVNTYTTNDQQFPSVAPLSDGGFVVTWESYGQDGDGLGIYGQRFDRNGTASGAEFQVNTYTVNDQQFPSIALLSDGGFAVTWQSGLYYGSSFWTFGSSRTTLQDGSGPGVFGQRFDSNGVKIDTEFQVNTYTTSTQKSSKIVALNDGGFLVIWSSHDQDGDGYGIFGQRFNASGNPIPLEISTTPIGTPTPVDTMSAGTPSTTSKVVPTSNTQTAQIGSTTPPSNTPSPTSKVAASNTQIPLSTKSSSLATSTSAENRPTIVSIENLIYGENYLIVMNDQVVGSYTVSGGTGLLDSGLTNVISFEFDPGFQPIEGEAITLFYIPEEEVGLWEGIEIEGETMECLEPHGNINNKLESYSFELIFEETTCINMSPKIALSALPLTLN